VDSAGAYTTTEPGTAFTFVECATTVALLNFVTDGLNAEVPVARILIILRTLEAAGRVMFIGYRLMSHHQRARRGMHAGSTLGNVG
jgi:hypothetical protein